MNVSTLQKHIGKFADLVESIQGNTIAKTELKQIEQLLSPYADRTLKDFGDFLKLANTYDPNKVVEQAKPQRTKAAPKPKAPKLTPAEVEATANKVLNVFEQAKRLNHTEMQNEITSVATLIDPLDKEALKVVILKITPGHEFKPSNTAPALKKVVLAKLKSMWDTAQRVRQ